MAHITQVKPFRLLDLPDELWVKIGKPVINGEIKITEQNFLTIFPAGGRFRGIPQQPAVTRICKVLRSELLPHYYQEKVDIALLNDGSEKYRGKWLRAIGANNRAQVRGIYFWDDVDEVEVRLQCLKRTWKLEVEAKFAGKDVYGDSEWTINILN